MRRELTAKKDRCGMGQCSGIFEGDRPQELLIIGKKLGEQTPEGNTGVRIDRGLVERALAGPISRLLLRIGL